MHTHSMRHQVARFLHTIWKCTNIHTVCGIRLHASCIQFGNAHTHSMRHQVARLLHTIWKCTHTVCGIRLHASCIQFGNAHTQYATSGCTPTAYDLEMHTHICGIRLYAFCIRFGNAHTQYATSGCTLLAYNLEMHKHTHSMRHQVARFLHTIWKCTNTHTACGIRLYAFCIRFGNAHTQFAASGCMLHAYNLEMHTHTACGIRLHASCIQFGNAQTHTVCGIRLHASCIQFRNAQTQTVCGIRMCASCIQFRNAQTVYFWSTTTPEQGTTPSLNDHPAQTTTHNLYDNSEHYWLPSALMSIHRLNDHEEYPQY